jgi:hypothetical protein
MRPAMLASVHISRRPAVRVANVPAEQFEAAVESGEPPTVTALAEMSKQSRVPPSSEPPAATASPITAPAGFKQATHLIGVVRDFAAFCQENDPVVVVGGLMKSEVHDVRKAATPRWQKRQGSAPPATAMPPLARAMNWFLMMLPAWSTLSCERLLSVRFCNRRVRYRRVHAAAIGC